MGLGFRVQASGFRVQFSGSRTPNKQVCFIVDWSLQSLPDLPGTIKIPKDILIPNSCKGNKSRRGSLAKGYCEMTPRLRLEFGTPWENTPQGKKS